MQFSFLFLVLFLAVSDESIAIFFIYVCFFQKFLTFNTEQLATYDSRLNGAQLLSG